MPDLITAFPWFGGKTQRVNWIRSLMPEGSAELRTQHYIEPCLGAGSVFLNRPRAHAETICDMNHGIVDFFTAMRDHFEELVEKLEWTPYSREEFRRCLEPCPDDIVENARRFLVRIRQTIRAREGVSIGNWLAGTNDNKANGWRAWLTGPTMQQIHNRLISVQIDSRDVLDTIQKFDSPNALFYVDPPYLPSTHKSSKIAYQTGEMSREKHWELCYALSNCAGKVAISGYDSQDYDDWLVGFFKHYDKERIVIGSSGLNVGEGKNIRLQEVVWTNFQMQQKMLFDFEPESDTDDDDSDEVMAALMAEYAS